MVILKTILQIIIAFSIFNVWIIRVNKATQYRGGNSKDMITEFAAYGLSKIFVYFVGSIKIISAIFLLIGIWLPVFTTPAASIISLLMLGAITMHLKIKDPIIKTLPSMIMFVFSVGVLFL